MSKKTPPPENQLHAHDSYESYKRAARAVESTKFALRKHDKMLAEHEINQIGVGISSCRNRG